MKAITRWPRYEISFAALLCAALILASVAAASDGNSIVGVWLTEGRDARIEIFRCGDKYCGKIVWMDEPYYTAKDKEGRPGELKLDIRNPDPALRSQTILRMQIMRDFTFDGGNRWKGGTVYDPESGKTYRASMTLVSTKELHLRGYVGIPLFGRTSTWTRANSK